MSETECDLPFLSIYVFSASVLPGGRTREITRKRKFQNYMIPNLSICLKQNFAHSIFLFCFFIILFYYNFTCPEANLITCPNQCLLARSNSVTVSFNTLRLRQNGRHFPDKIFKWIFLNENVWISINISLKFVPRGPINNIPTLVQVMAWRRPGDKPLSEPMMVYLLTHICVTRPQWVKHCCQVLQCNSTFLHQNNDYDE